MQLVQVQLGNRGPIHVNPAQVTYVEPINDNRCYIHFAGSDKADVSESATAVALRLNASIRGA